MGIKSKVFGFVAAAALSLSMVGAATAETKTNDAEVVLRGSGCSIAVAHSSFNFGVWDYNGTEYVVHPNHASNVTRNVKWVIKAGNPAGCDASIQFNGLTNQNPNYSSHRIGLNHFSGTMVVHLPTASINLGTVALNNPSLDLGNGFSNSNPFVAAALPAHNALGLPKFPTTTIDGSITLESVPDNVMPGTYKGTITSTATNGQ